MMKLKRPRAPSVVVPRRTKKRSSPPVASPVAVAVTATSVPVSISNGAVGDQLGMLTSLPLPPRAQKEK